MSGAVEGVALLPCPFCGWSAGNSVMDSGDEPYWVECADCYAQSGVAETRDAAITAWNTRTTPPARSYADEEGVLQMDREAFARLEDHEPGSMGWRMITEPTRGDCVGVQAFAAHRRAAIRLLSQGGKA